MAYKKKRKKQVKKSFKLILFIFIVVLMVFSLFFLKNRGEAAQGDSLGEIKNPEQVGIDLEGDFDNEDDDSKNTGEKLTFLVLDCGQGESILIDKGTTEILIDGGNRNDGESVCDKIKPYVDGELDYVIATHSHADHIGGLIEVYRKYKVCTTIYGDLGSNKTFKEFETLAKKKSENYINDRDMTIDLGDAATLTIYDVEDDDENTNNNSVITLLKYGSETFFSSGDAEKETEKFLKGKVNNGEPVDVVVAGHHGSNTANSLLSELSPQYFIISCGLKNSYGHPHYETLKKASEIGAIIYGTWKSGDIKFETNGEDLKCYPGKDITLTEDNAHARN